MHPLLVVTMSDTLYVPTAEYRMFVGFCTAAVAGNPPGKDHCQLLTAPSKEVDRSL